MTNIIQNTIKIAAFISSCKLIPEMSDRLSERLNELLLSDSPTSPWNDMETINQLSMSHGVEVFTDPIYLSQGLNEPICYYLNSGDTYSLTLVYDCIFQRYTITTLGDYLEQWESFKNTALSLKNIPIEWDEWVHDDDQAYFPIRMSYFEGNYQIWYGDVSYDTDHRGLWANSELIPEMSDRDYLDTILDLFAQIEDQKI